MKGDRATWYQEQPATSKKRGPSSVQRTQTKNVSSCQSQCRKNANNETPPYVPEDFAVNADVFPVDKGLRIAINGAIQPEINSAPVEQ